MLICVLECLNKINEFIGVNANRDVVFFNPAYNPINIVASVESFNGVVLAAADVISVSCHTILVTKVNTFKTIEKSNTQDLSTGIYIESITLIDGKVLNKQIFKR